MPSVGETAVTHNNNNFLFFTVVPHKSPNCSQPSGAGETMVSPIGIFCEAEGNGERKDMGIRKVESWEVAE